MFEIIFLVVVSVYFIQTIIFSIGANKKFNKLKENELPFATIIVAARNEEENILECMKSLNNSIYPEGKLEIIIVDDHSEDNTGKIIDEFIQDKPIFKKVIPHKQIGEVKGKANAIANAIELAKGEVILTTDADCTVSPSWAKTIASYYTKDVAIVCGYTNQTADGMFTGMQDMDFIYLLTVAGGTMNLGKPLSAIGNNMSYSKKAYDEVGGYAAIPFSVTEDFKLLMAIYNLKKYKLIYPLDKDALVTSKPCETPQKLYWQKKRWGVGGLDSDFTGFFVMITAWLSHFCILLAPFYFSVNVLLIMLFKILTDYFFLWSVYKKLNLKIKLTHFIAFEIYFVLYVLVLPVLVVFSRNIKWKGRKF